MKRLMGYGLLLVAFFLSGCITRITPYEVDRVDQELKGNRGVLMGKAEDLPEAKKKKTKKMYSIEIELPSRGIDKGTSDSEIKGNRGYLVGKKVTEEKVGPVKKRKGTKRLRSRKSYMKPQIVYQKPLGPGSIVKKQSTSKKTAKEKKEVMMYVVKKGDTLQKISSDVYGTTKKWKKIFDANKDILKDPDKISVGQKLVIPDLE